MTNEQFFLLKEIYLYSVLNLMINVYVFHPRFARFILLGLLHARLFQYSMATISGLLLFYLFATEKSTQEGLDHSKALPETITPSARLAFFIESARSF